MKVTQTKLTENNTGITKINILGEKWIIDNTEILKDLNGLCDFTTKKINICKKLDNKPLPKEEQLQNMQLFKRKVIRHEIIHAFMNECGMQINEDVHTERSVNWIALMYPKIKKIFEELGIEE